ncbi:MAG: InlB B-repeat-containing protein [Clostridia bacterium]|nr:InlB B-repeat-containing protein [Clostridia bacterium]
MKKIVSVVLVVLMLAALVPFSSFAAYENTHTNTGNQIEDLIAVATTQIGYKEGNNSSQLAGTTAGSGNYTKYGQWYGINPGAWCAMFVSWCANQAGIASSVIPKHASCDTGMNWFKNNGLWQNSAYFGGNYTPKRGDIIYFGDDPTKTWDSTHVGIVTGSDSSKVYTIEGNKGNQCKTYNYSLSSSYIFGYGTPKYTGTSSSTPSTNLGVYVVTASSLNMRSGPGTDYSIVGVLSNGDAIVVTQTSGKWAYTTYGTKSGWCSMNYLLAQSNIKYAISSDGIELIKGLEGFSATKYWDVSQWSIGYGTACGENDYPNGITESEAEALLRSALVKYELYVNKFLSNNNITINQNQYDALVSFTYNLGDVWSSKDFTLKTYLINGVSNYTADQIKSAFGEFVSAGGQVLSGLVARREAEANYFLTASDTTTTTNTVYVVTATSLRMREGPGTDYDTVGYLSNGDQITVTSIANNWGYTTFNNKTGWVSLKYCELVSVASKPYTLTFDPNGGTMEGPTEYKIDYGDYYKDIFDTIPVATRAGYVLSGWLCTKYNYTLTLAETEYYAVRENNTFTAQWTQLQSYTVTYNANGGTGAPPSQTKTQGTTLTLSTYTPTREGYTFLGWGTSASATSVKYQPGAAYSKDANLNLYAIWQENAPAHTEHTWTLTSVTNATCVNEGQELYTCTVCGTTRTETIAATGVHTYGTWSVSQAATCTAAGTETRSCTVCGASENRSVPASGHTWGDWTVTTPATTAAAGEKTRTCSVCSAVETAIVPKLSEGLSYELDNYFLVFHNAAEIDTIRLAPGVHTTSNDIRNAPGLRTFSTSLIRANTNDDGDLRIDLFEVGEYSIWVRMNDKTTTYIRWDIKLEASNISPRYAGHTGITVKIDGISSDVKDIFLAPGRLETYRECNDNKIVRFTSSYFSDPTKTTNYGRTINYAIDYRNVSDDGWYTICVRYNSANRKNDFEQFQIEYPSPTVSIKGLQITVGGLQEIRNIRIAPGEYETAGDVKRAPGVRLFNKNDTLKHVDQTNYSYTIQCRNDGPYTLSIEYIGGYAVVTTRNIVHLQPSVNVDGQTVTLGDLNDLYIIRYAPGTYTTASAIKNAPGSQYIRPGDITGSSVSLNLQPGTYSFNVQYVEESVNIFTITIADSTPVIPEYTLTFDPNGGSVSGTTAYTIKTGDKYVDVIGTLPTATRTGYNFTGWLDQAHGYTLNFNSSETFTFSENVTFKAQWSPVTYTVSYNANGGTGAPSSQTKYYGTALTLRTAVPTRSGYTFLGWATSSGASSAQYQPGGSYTANASVMLYAVWQKDPKPKQSISLNGQTLLEESTLADGVILSHVKTSSSSIYNIQNMNIVEFDPSQSNIYVNVVGGGTYAHSAKTVKNTITSFAANNPTKTPLFGVNGDLWMMTSAHARIQGKNTSYGGYSDAVVKGALNLPRGFTVYNGEIICSAHMYQETPYEGEFWSFGITPEGYPLIGCPTLTIQAKVGSNNISVDGLNRLPANNALVLYTDKGCLNNMALDDAYELLINVGYDYTVKDGASITGTVAGIYNSSTSLDPSTSATTMILTARGTAVSKINTLSVGSTVSFTFSVGERYDRDADLWKTVTDAVGGHMPFVVDGIKQETGTTTGYPSTIIGIKNDGNLIIIADDGRQSGFSRGLDFNDYAALADELNINTGFILDGGGSTDMVVLQNGQYNVVNSPSDGSERSVINSVIVSVGPSRQKDKLEAVIPDVPSSLTSLYFNNYAAYSMLRPNIQTSMTMTSEGAKITVDKNNESPSVNICFGFPGSAVNSSYLTVPSTSKKVNMTTYPYMVLEMKVSAATSSAFHFQTLYVGSGTQWGGTNNNFAGFNNVFNDRQFHKYVIDTSSNSYIAGQLNFIRLGLFFTANGATISNGDYVVIKSIKFAQTAEQAAALAQEGPSF